MTNRRKFNAEFRAEAVELVISSGRPMTQAARRSVLSRVAGQLGAPLERGILPRLVLQNSGVRAALDNPCTS